MSSRDLAINCLERVLVVERYYEAHHVPSAPPVRDAESRRPDAHAGESDPRHRGTRAPGDRPSFASARRS